MSNLVEGGTWEPERVNWDHHKIEGYIEDNWKTESDEELADSLSEMTGKNVTRLQVKDKRLDMGIDRSIYVRKHIDRSNCGLESVIDWDSLEVAKYIQTRYNDKSDLEIARGLSERFDEDVSWKMVRQHRLDMGYKREPNTKRRGKEFELGTPEYRKFIYNNHPEFEGDYETISEFLVEFYDKFDPPITLRTLKRSMRRFVDNDIGMKIIQKVVLTNNETIKIRRWLRF